MIDCKQQSGDPVWEQLKSQIDRLGQLRGFPKPEFEAAAYRELVLALQSANTVSEATRIVDDWVQNGRDCPFPVDLRREVYDRQEKVSSERLIAAPVASPTHCRRCGDCGFYGGHIGTKYDGPWKLCDCRAARERIEREPDFVDVANKERTELIERFSKVQPKTKRGGPASHVTRTIAALSYEDYRGDF